MRTSSVVSQRLSGKKSEAGAPLVQSWQFCTLSTQPLTGITPWSAAYVTQHQLLLPGAWARTAADARALPAALQLTMFGLLWGGLTLDISTIQLACPHRVRRRTISRGAMVRKKASRVQLEAVTAVLWQRLRPTPTLHAAAPAAPSQLMSGVYLHTLNDLKGVLSKLSTELPSSPVLRPSTRVLIQLQVPATPYIVV